MSLLWSRTALFALFASMTLACLVILKSQSLAVAESVMIKAVLLVQFMAGISLFAGEANVLYVCHLFYIAALLFTSAIAQNKAIVILVLATIVCAKICVLIIGDCPFHNHSDRVNVGAGGGTTFLMSDNALYLACILILLVRFKCF